MTVAPVAVAEAVVVAELVAEAAGAAVDVDFDELDPHAAASNAAARSSAESGLRTGAFFQDVLTLLRGL